MKTHLLVSLLITASILFPQIFQAQTNNVSSASIENFGVPEIDNIKLPREKPKYISKEIWSSSDDQRKKFLIYSMEEAAKAGAEYDKLSEKDKAKMAAEVEEAIKNHPTKKITWEEYMKERSAPPTDPGSLALREEHRVYSRKETDLYYKYPNKGEEYEKALLELKAAHESKRKEIKRKFFSNEKS